MCLDYRHIRAHGLRFVGNLVVALMLYRLTTVLCVSSVFQADRTIEPPKDISIAPTGEYDHEELQKLTEFRQRHRKTVDGMLCAAAFVRNGNKFTDCTTTEAPDGSVGKEWCYVEVQLVGVGFRDWDFCAGLIDYDILRSRAKTLAQLKAFELSHSMLQLSDMDRHLEKVLSYFENVCGHSVSRESDIQEYSRALHGLERALKQVGANWRTIHSIRNEYEALEEKISVSRKNALADRRNCAIVQGYSPAAIGDGIRATYFDNPYFKGPPIGFFDHPSLSLIFDEILPIPTVDVRSFSVRLEGFLKIPVTDNYTFYMDSDCNVRLFIDGELVIEHGLESRGKFASTFTSVGVVALDGRTTSHSHLKSAEVRLDGGKRFPIVLEYSHQSAFKYRDENVGRLTLSWSTPNMAQAIVPPEYFFRSRDSGETLIVSNLEAKIYDLAMLENGAQAFINSTKLLIADIPDTFRGSKMIRTVVKPIEEQVSFYISHDAIVYVAQSSQSSFIPKSMDKGSLFEKSADIVSVYSAGDGCEEAHDQQEFAIFYRRFNAGNVKIHLERQTSFFIFLQNTLANVVCQDDVQFLPFKNGDSCTASSSLSSEYDCQKGFGNGVWQSSRGRLRRQWIARTFVNPVELRYFHFSGLGNNSPIKAVFFFPDGSTEEFDLHSKLRYEFSHQGVVDSVRIEMEGSGHAASGENEETSGGTFALFGLECGSQVVTDKEVCFPVVVDFCQAGEACGSHYVDLGHAKISHGRLSYGWNISNVISSIGDIPFCRGAQGSDKVSSFVTTGTCDVSVGNKNNNLEKVTPIAQLMAPIKRIDKKGAGGGTPYKKDNLAPPLHTSSSAFDATKKALFISNKTAAVVEKTYGANGPPIYYSKESSAYLLKNKIGLPLGSGKIWTIDVPVHAVYTVEVTLVAFCGDLVPASLLLNGVEVLEGELLRRGQSIHFYGSASLERLGELDISSKSEGLFIVRLALTPGSS